MRVRLHSQARADLREALKWYDERSPLTAMAFAHELDRAISKIAQTPAGYSLAEHGTRRFVLQRFPFHIFYLTAEAEIVIIAVAHQKRRPSYWSGRVAPL